MKYAFWALVIVAIYANCKKNEPNTPPPLPSSFWGDASAQKNGKPWTANPSCWIDIVDKKTINIELDSFLNGYYLTETLFFEGVPPKTGTYKVLKWTFPKDGNLNADLTYSDADLALGDYDILETDSTNYLTLSSYDTLSKEIKGSFNLTFIVHKRPYSNAPDTIRFRDGKFHGKLIKK